MWGHCRIRDLEALDHQFFIVDLALFDGKSQLILDVQGLRCERVSRTSMLGLTQSKYRDWLYQITWEKQELFPAVVTPASATISNKNWLVFKGSNPVGDAFISHLEQRGEACITVEIGDEFKGGKQNYVINPSAPEHFQKLITELQDDFLTPNSGILYFWNIKTPADEIPTLATIQRGILFGAYSVTYLIQAMNKAAILEVSGFWLFSQNVHGMDPDGNLSIEQAALWGLARTIVHELPRLNCRMVDFSDIISPAVIDSAVASLSVKEIENQISWKKDQAYVARLSPILQSQLTARATDQALKIRSDCTYLITGGYGGIGLKVVSWLIGEGAQYLVLTSRREPSREVIHKLKALQKGSIEIRSFQGDVADYHQMESCMDMITTSMPSLGGVIHAAGCLSDATLLQIHPQQIELVTRAKIDGAWNLHQLTQNSTLDFFVLFSGAAAWFGSPGQSNYAAANNFLNALAEYRRGHDLPALSINWGPWSEVGMAAAQDNRGNRLEQQGIKSIPPHIGITILDLLLKTDLVTVGVLQFGENFWQQSYPGIAELPFFSNCVNKEETLTAPITSSILEEFIL